MESMCFLEMAERVSAVLNTLGVTSNRLLLRGRYSPLPHPLVRGQAWGSSGTSRLTHNQRVPGQLWAVFYAVIVNYNCRCDLHSTDIAEK